MIKSLEKKYIIIVSAVAAMAFETKIMEKFQWPFL